MAAKLTQQEFIRKAREVHGDKYTYDKFQYVNNHTKGCITCKIHGDFWMVPNNHLYGANGCPTCAQLLRNKKSILSEEEFIRKARKVHGDKYSYDKFQYVNCKTKGCITCKIHGDFWMKPVAFCQGQKCPECARTSRAFYKRKIAWKKRGMEVPSKSDFQKIAKSAGYSCARLLKLYGFKKRDRDLLVGLAKSYSIPFLTASEARLSQPPLCLDGGEQSNEFLFECRKFWFGKYLRREVPIVGYPRAGIDFEFISFCKVAIYLDGFGHQKEETKQRDAKFTHHLESIGYSVIRIGSRLMLHPDKAALRVKDFIENIYRKAEKPIPVK